MNIFAYWLVNEYFRLSMFAPSYNNLCKTHEKDIRQY